MVIRKAGIAGNHARLRTGGIGPGGGFVARGEQDEAPGSGQHFLRVNAFVGIALQPGHAAVMVLREPLLEVSGAGGRSCRRDAAIVKPQFRRALNNGRFHNPQASFHCNTIFCATSRAERRSVSMSTSACW